MSKTARKSSPNPVLSTVVDVDVERAVHRLAANEDRTVSAYLRKLISEHVKAASGRL